MCLLRVDARLKVFMCMLCIMLYVFYVFVVIVAFVDVLVRSLRNNIVLARCEAQKAKILNSRCRLHEIGMGIGFTAFERVILHTGLMRSKG